MSRHRPPSPSQLSLIFKSDRNPPPKALPSAALLEALAELLLAAIVTPTLTTSSGQPDDER